MANNDPIRRSALNVSEALSETLSVRGKNLDSQIAKASKHLPRGIKNSAEMIARAQRNARFTPYVSKSQAKALNKAERDVTAYVSGLNPKEDRRTAIKKWVSGLVLSYGLFLLLLAGFWYIATQLN